VTDYYPLLTRALATVPNADGAARDAIYQSARKAMMETLSQQPNSLHSDVSAEQAAFDRAVSRIEAERASAKARAVLAPVSVMRDFPREIKAAPKPELRWGAGPGAKLATQPKTTPEAMPEPRHKLEAVDPPRSAQERPMSRLDELNKILRKLQSDSPGLEASALISEDGLMIASALTPDLDETRVAGMTATLLNLGTRAAVELTRGDVKEVIIRGERGYAVMIDAGRGALLLALANETAKLGLIFFDMHEAIKSLKRVL
jgi:predicted regulator of Ras-like GTPase activity (Roadblock/LC7/MglB family)